MKKLVSFVKRICMLSFLLIILVVSYIVYDGYKLYKDVIAKESIETKFEKIKSDENYLEYDKIPNDFLIALVAVEDHRFFIHPGIDIISIGRAIVSNFEEKRLVEGGSTITQQLAKNMYFGFSKDFSRKVAELFVAFDIEEKYKKEDIITMYTNIIYFGEGYYGLNEAAKGYYNKEPLELTYDEITLLAGLPNAPSAFNPVENPDLAKKRQELVKNAIKKYNVKIEK